VTIILIVVLASLAGGVEVRNLNASHLSGLLLTNLGADRTGGLSCVVVNRSSAGSHFLGAHSCLIIFRVMAGVLLLRHGLAESVRPVSVTIELVDVGFGTLHHA